MSITISGAGIISGETTPMFSVGGSTTTSVSATINTTIILTAVSFDTASAYSTSTGKFQPTVAGYYQFNGSINWGGATGVAGKLLYLLKNGTVTLGQQAFSTTDTAAWEVVSTSGLAFLNGTTDYVSLVAYIAAGGPITPNSGFFSGFMVRA